jgi:hypothetical protein
MDEQRRARKAWGTVFMSVSADVKANLSGEARDARGGNAVTLWNEIREQHSALSGARTAQLIEVLFGTKIPYNESPPSLLRQNELGTHTDQLPSQRIHYPLILGTCFCFLTSFTRILPINSSRIMVDEAN